MFFPTQTSQCWQALLPQNLDECVIRSLQKIIEMIKWVLSFTNMEIGTKLVYKGWKLPQESHPSLNIRCLNHKSGIWRPVPRTAPHRTYSPWLPLFYEEKIKTASTKSEVFCSHETEIFIVLGIVFCPWFTKISLLHSPPSQFRKGLGLCCFCENTAV